jgi:hypothetical protein
MSQGKAFFLQAHYQSISKSNNAMVVYNMSISLEQVPAKLLQHNDFEGYKSMQFKKKKTKGRDSLLASLLREVATLEPEWPAAATSDRGASQATRES